MKRFLTFFPLLAFSFALKAQFIKAGPVVGGVTDTKARIQIHFDSLGQHVLEVSDDSTFNTSVKSFTGNPSAETYATWMFEVSGLNASTFYYYRLKNSANVFDSRRGRFKTFPAAGNKGYLKLAVGSCNYFSNSQLFQHLNDFEPDMVLHLGDWGYPPSAPGMGANYNLDTAKQARSFAIRYEDQTFKPYVLPYFPVDYVYDDDWGQNDSEGWTFPQEKVTLNPDGSATTELITHPLPAGLREGAIHAWVKFFPGYPLNHDTADGIHHKFTIGNVEVFMTDNRISRTPRHNAFKKQPNGNFTFSPDTNHTLLGVNQRYWLVNELKNSQADWKIITSGVIFNQAYKRILDFNMIVQNFGFSFIGRTESGLSLANAIAYNWVGYPVDQNALLNLRSSVKDMVFLSGDSHSSAIDDGTNSGIPEMQSSGWNAGDEGYLFYYIDSIGQSIGQPAVKNALWNAGGNGIENKNFSDTYGTVEVFADDSLRMCVVDELGQQLGCLTLLHSSKKTTGLSNLVSRKSTLMHLIYPNPAKNIVRVLWNNEYVADANDKLMILDMNGRILMEFSPSLGNIEIPVSQLVAGNYFIQLQAKQGIEERRLTVY